MDFLYVLGTVFFTVYAQLIIKWQVAQAGALPSAVPHRISFLLGLLLNPWIMSAMAAGFFALLCWLAAMTKFELSYAYPFMSLAFVLVLILSAVLFHETVTLPKVLGVMLVVVGLIVASRG
jgi:multidrug transporter EmrE-like cation transporter